MALGLAIGLLVPDAWLSEPAVRVVLLISLPLVPVRVLDSAVSNVLRAQQRSTLLSSYTAVRRYAVLGLVVLATLGIDASVMAFYVATLVAELVATGVMLVYAMRGLGVRPGALRTPLLREMLGFGLPMIVYDLSGVVLHLGDRFFIEGMLGPEALGVYSAAYNMCDYASVILLTSLNQALTPMYLKLWETEGKAATQAFVERSLHAYLIASAAIMAAICAMGADALTLLATERYRPGAVIIPPVMLAMLLAGCMPLIGAGLHIAKQTRTLMLMILASAIVNLVLNTLLIPRLGLLGAAYATLGCYVMEVVGAGLLAARVLPVRVPVFDLLKFSACGAAAYAAMQAVNEAGPLWMLIVEGSVGLAVFALAVLACDARSRDTARGLLQRRRRPA
jgi:O-antigen/teichoic acid export membrane protein